MHTSINIYCASIDSFSLDLHQPSGSTLVDIPSLYGVLCHLLAIQIPLPEGIGLLQIHSLCDGSSSTYTANYLCNYMLQCGWICAIFFNSTYLCGKKHSSSFLLSCTPTPCCCGYRTIFANTYILEILFRGMYIYVVTCRRFHWMFETYTSRHHTQSEKA